ncbi:hypothetical protein ACLOJK_033872 [Asimina triloba]
MARLGETILIFLLLVLAVSFSLLKDSSYNIAAGGGHKLSRGEILEALQFLGNVPYRILIAEDLVKKAKKKMEIRPLHQYLNGGGAFLL